MSEQEEFEFRRRREAEGKAAPKAVAESPSALKQVSDPVNAVGTGGLQGMVRLLGLPVDTMANVLDLMKAGAGTAYSEATGKSVPDALTPTDRKKVTGSGDYMVDRLSRSDLGRYLTQPQNPEYQGGYLQNAGMALGMGGPGKVSIQPNGINPILRALGSQPSIAMMSATAGKAVGDATGNPALAVAASMAPTAAKQAIIAGTRAVATPSDPRRAALARQAVEQEGIPLSIADTTDSGFIKSMRSTFNDTPGLSMIGSRQDAPKQGAFNRAVGRQFEADAPELNGTVMNRARDTVGDKFNRVYGNNDLQVDGQLMQRIMDVRNSATQLPTGGRNRVNGWVDDVLGQMQQGPNGQVIIPGPTVNRYQSQLRKLVDTPNTEGFTSNDLNNLRQGLLGGFNRSVTGQDAGLLSEARQQYKALKTVEPILNKADAGVAGRLPGDVAPGLLSGAVEKNYSDPSTTGIGQLSQIGSQFMTDRVKQTGGSTRAMIQNGLLGGGLLSAAGVASIPAAIAGGGAAALVQWAIGNPAIARAALRQGNLTPEQFQVLATVPGLLEDK